MIKVEFETEAAQVEQLTKKVEWKNGDAVQYVNHNQDLVIGRYIAYDDFASSHVIYSVFGDIYHMSDDEIAKPETPEQKAANEVMAWEGYFYETSPTEVAELLVEKGIFAPDEYRKKK